MRQHNIIFGIFLILSIFAFALATPVLVQEERNVHIPKDDITVLKKRGGQEEDFQELMDELDRYFIGSPEPVKSSYAHVLSSSAPAGPSHGLMDDVQAPAKNPRPSIDPNIPSLDRGHWMDSNFPPLQMHPKQQLSNEFGQANEDQVAHMQQPNPGPYNTMLPTQPMYRVVNAPPPNQRLGWTRKKARVRKNQRPWNSGTSPNPETLNPGLYDPRLPTQPGYRVTTAPSRNVGSPKAHVQQQPNLGPWNPGPSNPRPYNQRLPTGPGYRVATAPRPDVGWLNTHVQQPNPGPWNPGPSNQRLPTGPGYRVVTASSPNSGWSNALDFERYRYDAVYPATAKGKMPWPSSPRLPTGPGNGVVAASSPDQGLPDALDFERHIYGANYRVEDKAPGPSNPILPTGPEHGVASAPLPDIQPPDVAEFETHLNGAN